MNAPNLSAILDRKFDEIDAPKSLPKGTYIMQVQGLPVYDKSSKKQTDYAEFTFKPLQAMDDVSQEDLDEWAEKGDGTVKALADGQIKTRYYLTEDSAFRLRDFVKHCGIDMEEQDLTLQQAIELTPGCQVGVFVKHTPIPNNSEGAIRAEVARTFAIE